MFEFLLKFKVFRNYSKELTFRKTYFDTVGKEFKKKNFPFFHNMFYINKSKLNDSKISQFKYYDYSYFLIIILIAFNIINNLIFLISYGSDQILNFIFSIIFGSFLYFLSILVYKEAFIIIYLEKFKKLYKLFEIFLFILLFFYLLFNFLGFNGYIKFIKLFYKKDKKYFDAILILLELILLKIIFGLKIMTFLKNI